MKKVFILIIFLTACYATKACTGKHICYIHITEKSDSLVFCRGKWVSISNLKDLIKEHVVDYSNVSVYKGKDVYAAVMALQTRRGAKYKTYFAVQHEISKAYNELRNELALKLWSRGYNQLSPSQQQSVRIVYPMLISDTEPAYRRRTY